MKNVRNHIAAALFSLAALTLFSSCQTRWTSLEQGFQAPPDSVRAAVYWYWLDNKISKEGVVKDLEAMKRVGITRAFIGNQSTDGWDEGIVPLFSDEWWDVFAFAAEESARLGMGIGLSGGSPRSRA